MLPSKNRQHATHLSLILFVLLCGCGSSVRSPETLVNTALVAPADGSALLGYLDASIVPAGSASRDFVLTGAGFSATSVLMVDGAAHHAIVDSDSQIRFTLAAADLAIPVRHSITIQNTLAGGKPSSLSNTLTLPVASVYSSYGDSITAGATLTDVSSQVYPFLLGNPAQVPVQNAAFSGDRVCDVFPRQIYGIKAAYTAAAMPFHTLMIGTNDVDQSPTGVYETVFNACHQAAIAWLGTPRSSKLLAGDAAIHADGSCINTPATAHYSGISCNSSGAGNITAPLTVGGPIYIWYVLDTSALSSNTFAVAVDGVQAGTFATLPPTPVVGQTGAVSVGLVRILSTPGTHAITINAPNGGVTIVGIGSMPARDSLSAAALNALPLVLVGEIPQQLDSKPVASLAAQAVYNTDVRNNVVILASDGIDVRIAPTRSFMLGTPAELNDGLHPNVLGQQHLAEAFQYALR